MEGTLGLQGMINHMLEACDYSTLADFGDKPAALATRNDRTTATFMTLAEKRVTAADVDEATRLVQLFEEVALAAGNAPILGITGTGGAGKSSLTDEFVHRYLQHDPVKKIAVLSVDPTKQKTGGALLGDRIRMNAVYSDRVFMRSFATRGSRSELSAAIADAIATARAAGYDLIVVETSGIGQADNQITAVANLSRVCHDERIRRASQLEKIEMIDYGDLIVINKFDRRGCRGCAERSEETGSAQQAAVRPELAGHAGLRHECEPVQRCRHEPVIRCNYAKAW